MLGIYNVRNNTSPTNYIESDALYTGGPGLRVTPDEWLRKQDAMLIQISSA